MGAVPPPPAPPLPVAGAPSVSAMCAVGGGDCSSLACCAGALCIQNVCASDCSTNSDCLSQCCFALNSGQHVCAPSSLCAPLPTFGDAGVLPGAGVPLPPAPGSGRPLTPITTCNTLTLVADDGQYLGVASSNAFASDGVCNEFSSYGNQFGADSIHNEFGTYGSEFSSMSAYNEFTSTPPRLRCESGDLLNPVTKNQFLPGAIDPDVLCETLAANGY